MSDLLVPSQPSGLSRDAAAASEAVGQLQNTSPEDFLPAPGRWATHLGQAILLAAVLGSASLLVWPLRETVRAEGVVRPSGDNSVLQSEFGGRLRQVSVVANQTVSRGELLAVIEPTGMQEERRQLLQELIALERQERQARLEQQSIEAQLQALGQLSQAQLESSRRTVDQARANRAFERSELARYTQLLDSGAVPASLVDEKRARQLVSESEVSKALQAVQEQQARGWNERARLQQAGSQARSAADELQKQVLQRRTRLRQVERALAEGVLRAPLAASVVSTALNHPGQLIQPGQAVLTLAPLEGRMDVRLLVPPRDISQIRPGQTASLRLASCPTPEYGVMPARVLSLSQDTLPSGSRETAPGTMAAPQAYEVRLQPEKTALRGRQGLCRLRLGMDVVADVVTRRSTVAMFLLNKLRLGG